MGDPTRGLYSKFKIERTDGSSAPGGKHERCVYFVLDLEHDKHARAALKAYARSCAKEFPLLAADLRRVAATKAGGFASQPWTMSEQAERLMLDGDIGLKAERDEAVRLLHMLDNQDARHPDVAAFLDGLDD
jgi:hypothetical protein